MMNSNGKTTGKQADDGKRFACKYRERGNPDNNGATAGAFPRFAAGRICREANWMFPAFYHWFEELPKAKEQKEEAATA